MFSPEEKGMQIRLVYIEEFIRLNQVKSRLAKIRNELHFIQIILLNFHQAYLVVIRIMLLGWFY